MICIYVLCVPVVLHWGSKYPGVPKTCVETWRRQWPFNDNDQPKPESFGLKSCKGTKIEGGHPIFNREIRLLSKACVKEKITYGVKQDDRGLHVPMDDALVRFM